MKKIIALILAVLTLVAMLAGCQTPTKETEKETEKETQAQTQPDTQDVTEAPSKDETQNETKAPENKPNTEAAVGDILDAPEVTFDESIEDLYIYYTYPGETEEEVLSMEIAIDQVTDDTYVIYVSDGLLKLDEVVYEVNDDSIAKYYKDVFAENFTQETALSADELQAEVDDILSLISLFIIPDSIEEGTQFRKTDIIAISLTGDVYTYELLSDGEVVGEIWIDVATGLIVRYADTDGVVAFSVQQIETSNIEIPEYK